MNLKKNILASLLAGVLTIAGCVTNEPKKAEPAPRADAASPASAPAAAAAPAPASAPVPAAATVAATANAPVAKPVCSDVPAKKTAKKTSKKNSKTAPDPACVDTAQAVTPVAAAPVVAPVKEAASAPASSSGGYDLSKNKPVTDSTKAEAGQGTRVKGINDWEGEISGIPAANSKFTRLKIGMPLQQTIDLIGPPTDQGAYVTGKAFIPFYFGSDKTRWETAYKGQGRLIFANQAGFSTGQYLIWIIHNSNDGGYR